MEEVRLQKYISECGIMSRRAAEKEILSGNITVNNTKAELGQKIIPGKDIVAYKGRVIKQKRNARHTYIMLNKPIGYVTTLSDDKERKCVADLIKDVDTRVYPVGRLDLYSEGLLIFTNDGELANKMMHPRHEIPKIYHVKVDKVITPAELKALSSPMIIDDYEIQPVKCEILSKGDYHTLIQMTLYEGRNRQIRNMCEKVGLNVIKLRRVAVGDIELGDLKVGKWRYLDKAEVNYLKNKNK